MDIFSRLRALESYQRKVEDGRLEQPEWLDAIRVQIDGLRTVHNHLAAVQASLESRTDELEAERKEILIAVSEGIERTGRAERRVKATVERARRQLEESDVADEGLEAEAHNLRILDGRRKPSRGGGARAGKSGGHSG